MAGEDMIAQLEQVQIAAHPLLGISHDYDALMELVGDATIALLGEASHGSHEFYQAVGASSRGGWTIYNVLSL